MSKINLTEEEKSLFESALDFNNRNSFEENQESLEASAQLMDLLLKRKAVPRNRLKYFTDREFQYARTKLSRKEVFESNGTIGNAIFKHPHFVKYLGYFVNGAKVSHDIYEVAKASIETNQFYEAISIIIEYLRVKKYIPVDKKKRNDFADEIFKLTVDLGFDTDSCFNVRKEIRSSKY